MGHSAETKTSKSAAPPQNGQCDSGQDHSQQRPNRNGQRCYTTMLFTTSNTVFAFINSLVARPWTFQASDQRKDDKGVKAHQH